jgi:hypothetical protein
MDLPVASILGLPGLDLTLPPLAEGARYSGRLGYRAMKNNDAAC